ncbi:MAG: glycosyltransferase family 39 protein [Anaerolineae bacterium]|nr:glycosyltransferase family 39 protein [Anaerolineae bacterium]
MSKRNLAIVGLLLLLFWTRLHALTALPLHNDEGLQLTRAIGVWKLHPFWSISDSAIINHWLIAAFYPQNAGDFAGRIATVFVALIGMVAGIALLRRTIGDLAAGVGAVMWLLTPPLFFYERLALSNAQAAALAVVALWAALRLARTGKRSDAILTGIGVTLAILFNSTAAPFAFSVVVIVLLAGEQPLRWRVTNLLIIAVVGIAGFAVPLAYSLLRGHGFGIAFDWLGTAGSTSSDSMARLLQFLVEFGGYAWWWLLVAGLILLPLVALTLPGVQRREVIILWIAGLLPTLTIVLVGKEIMPRHLITGLPILVLLAGAGIATLLQWIARYAPLRLLARFAVMLIVGWLLYDGATYFDSAYNAPDEVSLPPLDSAQFITDHSSGFGLREAALNFPQTVPAGVPIFATMFPDSCRRTNFYAPTSQQMVCSDAPGEDRLRQLMAERGTVYVLVQAPPIGLDLLAAFGTQTTLIASYPRPGETENSASVRLWRIGD